MEPEQLREWEVHTIRGDSLPGNGVFDILEDRQRSCGSAREWIGQPGR
jgi:hypothetical protein